MLTADRSQHRTRPAGPDPHRGRHDRHGRRPRAARAGRRGDLVASVPGLPAFPDLEAITILNKPSAHLTLEDQLRICRAARDAARRGIGVVVTHGTDTLEETAMLCDVLHDADAPIVFTGAIRPAIGAGRRRPGQPRRRGERRAPATAAAGMGVLVVFGGEIHHARCARKTDTTSLVAFSSPQTGPLGPGHRGAPDDLVAHPAQPAAGPARASTGAC